MEPSSPTPGNGSPTGTVLIAPPGSSADWASALAEHAGWLRTVVRSRLGEDQGVDEVMQDVSLAAVAQQTPLADPSRLGAWLYQIAVRQTLLYRRKCGRHRKLVNRYAKSVAAARTADGPSPASPDPLRWLLAEEQGQLVRQAVDDLPESDRDLFLLKYTEGWSYRELANRLGLTESAVEARLHRIRLRLRAALARAADS